MPGAHFALAKVVPSGVSSVSSPSAGEPDQLERAENCGGTWKACPVVRKLILPVQVPFELVFFASGLLVVAQDAMKTEQMMTANHCNR